MRHRLALAAFALLGLVLGTRTAQPQVRYMCPTWNAYYPGVLTCPVPWRAVTPRPAIAAVSPPVSSSRPTAALPPGFPGPGEPLYDWCANEAKRPASVAICSDPELRSLTIERQRAFNDTRWGLDPQRDKELMADQGSWVMSYPKACGLSLDAPPALPLASPVRDCMANAGRARIAYLRAFRISAGEQTAQSAPTPAIASTFQTRIGPSFDCTKATSPLAQLICKNPELSIMDLRFNQAYLALWHQLDPGARRDLQDGDLQFIESVKEACGVQDTGPITGSASCVLAQYDRQRQQWLKRLAMPAFQEAIRPIEEHIALQAQLQKLGFLPDGAKIDGVYGKVTREAILAWQRANGRTETGFLNNADAVSLGAVAPQERPAPPETQPAPAPPPTPRKDELLAALSKSRTTIEQGLPSIHTNDLHTQAEELLAKLAAANRGTSVDELERLSRSGEELIARFNESEEFDRVSAIATNQVRHIKDDLKDLVTDAPYLDEIQNAITTLEKSQKLGNLLQLQTDLGNLNRVHERYKLQIERDRFGRL